MTTIGLELKISRPDIVSRKLSTDVAREAGISRPHVSRIEKGRIPPIPEVEAALKRIVHWTPAVHDFLQQVLAEESKTGAPANSQTGARDSAPDQPSRRRDVVFPPDAVYSLRHRRQARLRIRR